MRGLVGVNEFQMLSTIHLKIYRAKMYNNLPVLQTNYGCMYVKCGI